MPEPTQGATGRDEMREESAARERIALADEVYVYIEASTEDRAAEEVHPLWPLVLRLRGVSDPPPWCYRCGCRTVADTCPECRKSYCAGCVDVGDDGSCCDDFDPPATRAAADGSWVWGDDGAPVSLTSEADGEPAPITTCPTCGTQRLGNAVTETGTFSGEEAVRVTREAQAGRGADCYAAAERIAAEGQADWRAEHAAAPVREGVTEKDEAEPDEDDLDDAGIGHGDTIRDPATLRDIGWLTHAYTTESERASAIRILAALRACAAPERRPEAEIRREILQQSVAGLTTWDEAPSPSMQEVAVPQTAMSQVQPYAWEVRRATPDLRRFTVWESARAEGARARGCIVTPLYTHPVPVAGDAEVERAAFAAWAMATWYDTASPDEMRAAWSRTPADFRERSRERARACLAAAGLLDPDGAR